MGQPLLAAALRPAAPAQQALLALAASAGGSGGRALVGGHGEEQRVGGHARGQLLQQLEARDAAQHLGPALAQVAAVLLRHHQQRAVGGETVCQRGGPEAGELGESRHRVGRADRTACTTVCASPALRPACPALPPPATRLTGRRARA